MPRTTTPSSARFARTIAAAVPLQPVSAEPGSLTQISSRAATKCPVCTGTRLTKLTMVLTDGSPVDFTSCHTCEHKTWMAHDGAVLPVDTVLAKARKPR
jgi:formate dehydrogenase maturation protein FdhE